METKDCNLWWEFGTTKLFTLLELVLKLSGCIDDISSIYQVPGLFDTINAIDYRLC